MTNQAPNSYTHSDYPFTMIENDLMRNSSLSCKAFKLLCLGLSHSNTWTFRKSQIATCFKEGMHTVDEAMKELREAGYLHLTAKHGEGNKFTGHNWFWFRKPITEDDFKLFFRNGDFRGLGESGVSENDPCLRRTRLKKTNININDINDGETPAEDCRAMLKTDTERKIFDRIVKYRPKGSDKAKPSDVSWWIKSFGHENVIIAMDAYCEQVRKCRNKKRAQPKSMGAYVRGVLNENKKTEEATDDFSKNKAFAIDCQKDENKTCEPGQRRVVVVKKDHILFSDTGKSFDFILKNDIFMEGVSGEMYRSVNVDDNND